MTVKMAATFQNGCHENIKHCIYLIFWRDFYVQYMV